MCSKTENCQYNDKIAEINNKISELIKDVNFPNSGIFIRINCPGYYIK